MRRRFPARAAAGRAATLTAFGCAAVPALRPAAPAAPGPRTPVVFVGGVSATILRDTASGRVVWGEGRDLLWPRDGGYDAAAPVAGPRDAIEPAGVLLEIRLGPFVRKPVYQPLVDALSAAGYVLGDLERPRPGDDLFLFAYDWRRDNVEAAARLAASLTRLRAARGGGELAVDLVCQSNGAHICRYLAKHGGSELERAEAGIGTLPTGIEVRRLVLVGASNGGALRILRLLNRGRRYIPVVGRHLLPEVFFSMAALYQDLPAATSDLFLDAGGEPLAVDLYDATEWERHDWSLFAADAARRADRRPDLFGSLAERQALLATQLDRARRFQVVLARDAPGFGATAVYLLENGDETTPLRAALLDEGGRPQTLFAGDERVGRLPGLADRLTAAGDGHASLASQRALSPQELAALTEAPRRIHGPHFETILEPETLAAIVAALTRVEAPAVAAPRG